MTKISVSIDREDTELVLTGEGVARVFLTSSPHQYRIGFGEADSVGSPANVVAYVPYANVLAIKIEDESAA